MHIGLHSRCSSEHNRLEVMESYLSSPVVKSFLAGSFSGTCSTILFQPLDLLKTRLQMLPHGHSRTRLVTVTINIVRHERIVGLWRGVVPSLLRTVPGIGVYFSSLHWLKAHLGSSEPSHVETMTLGACARCISGFSLLPFTVLKTRFECGQFQYKSIVQALSTIYSKEGNRGLFSGLSATLLRDAPFSGLYLMIYTYMKKLACENSGANRPPTTLIHFGCGIVAGCVASLITQPADVMKTHMQISPHRFRSIRTVVMFIYQSHGLLGFMRGIVPRTLRRSVMAAMAWTVYEQIMAKFARN